MTPHDDPGLLAWILDHAWALVLALVGVIWKQNQAAMKAQSQQAAEALLVQSRQAALALQTHKDEDQRSHQELREEQATQRAHIGKLFDKLEEHGRRSEDRHTELLKALHEGLRSKADRWQP